MLRALSLSVLLATGLSAQKLLIVDVDDLGREFVAAHPQPFFQAADQVARKYTNFYTAPLCSPSRAMMNYGVRPTHPGLQCGMLTDYAFSPYDTPVDGKLVTLAQAVSAAGYSTAKIGKWHLARPDQRNHPNECGWQRFVGQMSNVADYEQYQVVENGTPSMVSGIYLTHLQTALGVRAMRDGFDLVSVSYTAIHKPFHVPPAGTYTGPVPVTNEEKAAATLEALTRDLCTLIEEGARLGYTVMLFSDNGGVAGLGGCKSQTRECGVHTFLYCYGPGILPGEDDSLVGVLDVYATTLEFFGIEQDEYTGPESISFAKTWAGLEGDRQYMYTERHSTNGIAPVPSMWEHATIGKTYKYRYLLGFEFFYELPGETFNLLQGGVLSPSAQAALDELRAVQEAITR